MKRIILINIILLTLFTLFSCSDPTLNTNSAMQAELDERAEKPYVSPFNGTGEEDKSGRCMFGHAELWTSVTPTTHRTICLACGEVYIEETPHCDITVKCVSTLVFAKQAYAEIETQCGYCYAIIDNKFIPFDHTKFLEEEE